MRWLLALVALTAAEWLISPRLPGEWQWELALGAKYLAVALVLQALLAELRTKDLLYRSVVALFCIIAWVDAIGHAAWALTGGAFNSSLPIFVIFCGWLAYVTCREYKATGDPINNHHVFILFLRPQSALDVAKAFFGFPACSVCLYHAGIAWSYRAKSGRFERRPVSKLWLAQHIAVNTYKTFSPAVEVKLESVIGSRRFPGIKCLWTIRHVLKAIGPQFKPRWYEYLPGIYAARLLRCRS